MKETTKNYERLELDIYDIIIESGISNREATAKLVALLGIFISRENKKLIDIDELTDLISDFIKSQIAK